MTRTIYQRTRNTFLWVMAIPLLLGALSFWTARRYQESIAWVSHTQEVLVAVKSLLVTVTDAESSLRGYLLTGEPLYREPYLEVSGRVSRQISFLHALTIDNPAQQAALLRLAAAIRSQTEKMRRVLALGRTSELLTSEAVTAMREESELMEQTRHICDELAAEETRLLQLRAVARRTVEIEVAFLFALGIAVSVLLLFFANRVIEIYAGEREQAEQEIRRLNSDLQARIEQRTGELQKANERLSRSNKDLTQFAYIASHDLQEPLRTIGSYVGLLGRRYEGKLDEQADKYIRFVVDGAKRMQTLVQDLLAYSRVGTQPLNVGLLDMNEVLELAKQNLRLILAERKPVITCDPLPSLIGDSGKLVQVFQNLIGNCLKFAKPGETARIHVGARRADQEWILSVQDNGIGFESLYAERIFVIFQRLHQIGTYPGTGIGLAICQRIVEAHGGRIWAESEPAVGSTFFLSLPVDIGKRMDGNGSAIIGVSKRNFESTSTRT